MSQDPEKKTDCVISIRDFGETVDIPSASSAKEQLPERCLSTTGQRVSNFLQEWTPFLLVASYFVFSVCLYMICTERFVSIFWWIYMPLNFYIASMTVMEAFLSFGPTREARKAVTRAAENNWVLPTPDKDLKFLDLIIVAYLPNEKDIIMDRAHYLLETLEFPLDKIRINVVYNTPKPIEPLETELHAMMKVYPHFRVIKVPNSTSKADNLNYFLSLPSESDVIAIYDCDHYPHPRGPRWAMERFSQDPEVDIVQGRCIVFNSDENFLTGMIAVEFDKIYAVSHPGRATMWGFGLFCGSNGYWRADLLRELKMDGDMLTEDIDSALRACSRGAKVVHDLNVTSYELAPTTWLGFWKQRLRWAQGWAQASMKHLKLTWSKPEERPRSVRVRFGILSLLFVREVSYYLVTQYTCLVFSFVITRFPKSGPGALRFLFFQYPVAWWLFFVSMICLFATLWITNRVKSEFINARMIIVFSILYPAHIVFNSTLGLYGHARQIVNYTSWNPTART